MKLIECTETQFRNAIKPEGLEERAKEILYPGNGPDYLERQYRDMVGLIDEVLALVERDTVAGVSHIFTVTRTGFLNRCLLSYEVYIARIIRSYRPKLYPKDKKESLMPKKQGHQPIKR